MWDKQPCRHCGKSTCGGWCTEPSCDMCQDAGVLPAGEPLPAEPCDECRRADHHQWLKDNPEVIEIKQLRDQLWAASYSPPVPTAGYNPMAGGIDQDKHMIEAPLIGHRQKAVEDLEIQIQAQYRRWIERVEKQLA